MAEPHPRRRADRPVAPARGRRTPAPGGPAAGPQHREKTREPAQGTGASDGLGGLEPPDLLGAIQALERVECAQLPGTWRLQKRPERLRKIPAICGRCRQVWANESRRWPGPWDGTNPGRRARTSRASRSAGCSTTWTVRLHPMHPAQSRSAITAVPPVDLTSATARRSVDDDVAAVRNWPAQRRRGGA
jgi:hypothetical protein